MSDGRFRIRVLRQVETPRQTHDCLKQGISGHLRVKELKMLLTIFGYLFLLF